MLFNVGFFLFERDMNGSGFRDLCLSGLIELSLFFRRIAHVTLELCFQCQCLNGHRMGRILVPRQQSTFFTQSASLEALMEVACSQFNKVNTNEYALTAGPDVDDELCEGDATVSSLNRRE